MEIRTGSSDINSSRHESIRFDRVQWRSNESQYGRKTRSDVKRELEENGISFLRKIRDQFEPGKANERATKPCIEEQTRSGNKNIRRRGNQQQADQERKGKEERTPLAEPYIWRS
ncbi:hypothetical protein TNCV_1725821 [Trichonephila clavipes]|nr:hypothetical protein TNCV_1725821 [Trichonephila clavipes]